MTILHASRKLANRLLSPLGVAIVRAQKESLLRKTVQTVRIGNYSIEIPAINPLAKTYLQFPESVGHLGRLATLLKKKYPALAAIDIGANVGDTASIIKSAADIPLLCVEGDDFSFSFLERNAKQFQNVAVHKLFFGEKTETVSVAFEKSGWNTTIKPGGEEKKINLVSLDDFLAAKSGVDNYKLLKIDTEGFDCPIIRGGVKFFQRTRPIITFEYNRDNMDAIGENGLDTLALLARLGYSQIFYHDCFGRFFFSTILSNESAVRDIHDYADGRHPGIYYFDLTIFHEEDNDVAAEFAKIERLYRENGKDQT